MMARHSSRRLALVLLTLVGWAAARSGAQAISVMRVADAVNVKAPGFTFIKGEPLARLKDGRSVRVDLDLAVLPRAGAASVAETRQTFILSYDLWEERVAVMLVASPARSAAYLTTSAAETWCLDQLAVPVKALGAVVNGPIWVRIGYRMLETDPAPAADDGAGVSLQSLIEALSRRRKASEWTHSVEAGPFRLRP
jgi:hypothetical protein